MEQDQDRCGYEDRREGTDEDTKQHRGYEGTYDLAAQQEQRQQGQESGYARHRRAREHFVVGQVKQLAERHLLESPQVLADTVVDHDGVIERIADNGEDRCNGRKVELELRDYEEAERQYDVIHRGNDGADGELPLESHPHVNKNPRQRGENPEYGGPGQFA